MLKWCCLKLMNLTIIDGISSFRTAIDCAPKRDEACWEYPCYLYNSTPRSVAQTMIFDRLILRVLTRNGRCVTSAENKKVAHYLGGIQRPWGQISWRLGLVNSHYPVGSIVHDVHGLVVGHDKRELNGRPSHCKMLRDTICSVFAHSGLQKHTRPIRLPCNFLFSTRQGSFGTIGTEWVQNNAIYVIQHTMERYDIISTKQKMNEAVLNNWDGDCRKLHYTPTQRTLPAPISMWIARYALEWMKTIKTLISHLSDQNSKPFWISDHMLVWMGITEAPWNWAHLPWIPIEIRVEVVDDEVVSEIGWVSAIPPHK